MPYVQATVWRAVRISGTPGLAAAAAHSISRDHCPQPHETSVYGAAIDSRHFQRKRDRLHRRAKGPIEPAARCRGYELQRHVGLVVAVLVEHSRLNGVELGKLGKIRTLLAEHADAAAASHLFGVLLAKPVVEVDDFDKRRERLSML